jgi:hypothetical protein
LSHAPALRAFALVLLAGSSAAARAACPAGQVSSLGELHEDEASAEAAFVEMNLGAFKVAKEATEGALSCLVDEVGTVDAAGYHRVMALAAFLSQDSNRTLNAFRSVLASDPTYQLPSNLAPPGNPLHSLYLEARSTPYSSLAPLVAPADTIVQIDGASSDDIPVDRPVVVQVLVKGRGDDRIVLWTGYVERGSELPDLAAAILERGGVDQDLAEPNRSRSNDARVRAAGVKEVGIQKDEATLTKHHDHPTGPVLIGAGGAALASGVLYGLSWKYRSEYDDLDTKESELESLRQRTNIASVASLGAGVAAVGLGTMAVVWIRW